MWQSNDLIVLNTLFSLHLGMKELHARWYSQILRPIKFTPIEYPTKGCLLCCPHYVAWYIAW